MTTEARSLPIFGAAQLTSINDKEKNFEACANVIKEAKEKGNIKHSYALLMCMQELHSSHCLNALLLWGQTQQRPEPMQVRSNLGYF